MHYYYVQRFFAPAVSWRSLHRSMAALQGRRSQRRNQTAARPTEGAASHIKGRKNHGNPMEKWWKMVENMGKYRKTFWKKMENRKKSKKIRERHEFFHDENLEVSFLKS
jgi:hypothetical protein